MVLHLFFFLVDYLSDRRAFVYFFSRPSRPALKYISLSRRFSFLFLIFVSHDSPVEAKNDILGNRDLLVFSLVLPFLAKFYFLDHFLKVGSVISGPPLVYHYFYPGPFFEALNPL